MATLPLIWEKSVRFPLWDGCLTCDEVVHQRGRDAEDAHQQVADGQVEDEEVDDGAHVTVLHHDEAHQDVSHHAQQEDEKVGQDVAGSHEEGVLVVGRDGDVGDIQEALQAGVQDGCQDGRPLQLCRLLAGAVLRLHPVGGWALRWGEKRDGLDFTGDSW